MIGVPVGNPAYPQVAQPSIHTGISETGMCGAAMTDQPVTWKAIRWLPVCVLSNGHSGDHEGIDPQGRMESVVRWPAAVDASCRDAA